MKTTSYCEVCGKSFKNNEVVYLIDNHLVCDGCAEKKADTEAQDIQEYMRKIMNEVSQWMPFFIFNLFSINLLLLSRSWSRTRVNPAYLSLEYIRLSSS